ncbi:alpha/beta-hydrolase [Lizonia empirigonia]|nr:alpha/beta-hydrolase [Lizonia empirigonia]
MLLFVGLLLIDASPLKARDAETVVALDYAKPIVTLDYITLQGATSTSHNLTYFRRIPFGASTAGQNRFRAPQPPPITNDTYETDRDFDMCPQRTVNGSEDCLYVGVYSRAWQAGQTPRPGSAAFSIPPSGYPVLNASASNDYVVVYSNYRTNVFGFLGGRKLAQSKHAHLNTGLLDQQAPLKWIQKYIHHFGGAKDAVTIWGQSADGGSVVAQSIATGNRGKKLAYAQVLTGVGCSNHGDEIACLKTADLQALHNISLSLSTSQQSTTSSFTWSPVLDTSFLTIPLSTATFTPPSFSSWLTAFLPGLPPAATARLTALYPASGTAEEIAYTTSAVRAGLVYRDLVLACPALWLSGAADQGHARDNWNQTPLTYTSTGYTSAMASSVSTGDPNVHKLTNTRVPGVDAGQQFIVSATGLRQGRVGSRSCTAARCAFCLGVGGVGGWRFEREGRGGEGWWMNGRMGMRCC